MLAAARGGFGGRVVVSTAFVAIAAFATGVARSEGNKPATTTPPPAPDPAGAIVVVVHPDSPLRDVSAAWLRRLYLGEPMWDERGVRLVPLNWAAGSATRTEFDRAILRMTPEEVGRYWIDRKIRGGGGAPRTFSLAATIRRLVMSVPGAVGYLRAIDLDTSVRNLAVDGRHHARSGYVLAPRAHDEAKPK
jgi:hypothetical protein